jgi:branched-chain amino acid transport system substrate-binding protein
MVGLQITAVKQQLGSQINGIVNYDWWVPSPKMEYPGMAAFLKTYQAKAPGENIDPMGYYLPPFAYANMQVLGEAITATKSMDHKVVADHIRKTTFKTIIGDIKYGKDGEWEKPRVLMLQYRNIKGNDLEQFRTVAHEAILDPPEYKSDGVVAPFVPEGKK